MLTFQIKRMNLIRKKLRRLFEKKEMTKIWAGRTMLTEEKKGWPHRRKN